MRPRRWTGVWSTGWCLTTNSTTPSPSCCAGQRKAAERRSEEHTFELQSHVNLVCRLPPLALALFPYTTLFRSCHTPAVPVARTIGRKRLMELALTGEVIDAATALDWGLVNRVVPDDELDDAVAELLCRATQGSRAKIGRAHV